MQMSEVEVSLFAFDEVMRMSGRNAMNRALRQTVDTFQPDLCFFFLFTDEISSDTIAAISKLHGPVTINWFADDHWRFESFSSRWAPLFHWSITTDRDAPEKYHQMGYRNIIRSQWGVVGPKKQMPALPLRHDVTFVGQAHSSRKHLAGYLRSNDIEIECWGKGWSNGRLSREEMVTMFAESRINLNFSESSSGFELRSLVKSMVTRRADDSLRLNRLFEVRGHLMMFLHARSRQIKGRNFEIPGCGGFLLTQNVPGIEEYYLPGKEIGVFETEKDLVESIRYYLRNDDEREAIRSAGERRTRAEHTYEQRFREIFRIVLKQ
jgi:spore maturation protein CgeB